MAEDVVDECGVPPPQVGNDLQYENRPTCNCSTVDLTEKCMVLVLAMYGGARRMHAVHASPLV